MNTNFYNNKIPKEGSQCVCLSVISIDSVFRKNYCRDKNYHLQVFLEECNLVVKEKRTSEYINDNIEISSDSERKDSDEKN